MERKAYGMTEPFDIATVPGAVTWAILVLPVPRIYRPWRRAATIVSTGTGTKRCSVELLSKKGCWYE